MQEALNGTIDGSKCFIASDKVHAWEILKNLPGTSKIAVGFESEKARVNFAGGDITGRVNQYLYATISRGRGLAQTRSDNLIYGTGGGRPLFELAEEMRDVLRVMRFNPANDEVPDYVGMDTWNVEFWGIDALEVKIWVGTQLGLVSSTSEEQSAII